MTLLLLVLLTFSLFSCGRELIQFSMNRMIKQIEKECKKDCKIYEEYSDEWCNCMNFCFDMDEGASICTSDSTKIN